DRRCQVPARAGEPLAAADDGRALLARPLDRAEDPVEAQLADDRADVVELRGRPDEAAAKLVVDGVEDDDAACGGTALARVRESRSARPANGVLEVGVVAHDERVLAAELEADLREPPSGRLVDP